MLGELEYSGTFFAHSFVLCVEDLVIAADERASNRGDVTGFPLGRDGDSTGGEGVSTGGDITGAISGDSVGGGIVNAFEFLLLLGSQSASIPPPPSQIAPG